MLAVVTAAEMRELDRYAIEEIGLPGAVLMETAGRRLAGAVLATGAGEPVAVICGTGNNGGDGFVCARVLLEHGVSATVYLCADEDSISGVAATHFRAYRECGGGVVSIADGDELEEAEMDISSAAVVVDAIFGIGLTRPVGGHHADVIEVINEVPGVIIACDVPSGLDADSGRPLGACVRADITVTMAFAKRGLVGEPGFAYAGEVKVVEIGIPTALGGHSDVVLFEDQDAADILPWPEPTDHKFNRGAVLVLGGSPGKRGAARLAAWASLRVGAGLVTWASPSGAELRAPDPIMSLALDRKRDIGDWLGDLLERADAVVLGPGMATDDWGRALTAAVLAESKAPIVIDADGLNHLAREPGLLATCDALVVLTPHPGEAAVLLGKTSDEVQADRLACARALAKLGAVAVLKGAKTIVDDGRLASIGSTGNAGMATAGAGDVLAGIIGGLLAQGVDAASAARLGVHLHGLAGDFAAVRLGPLSVTADDIAGSIHQAIRWIADEDEEADGS